VAVLAPSHTWTCGRPRGQPHVVAGRLARTLPRRFNAKPSPLLLFSSSALPPHSRHAPAKFATVMPSPPALSCCLTRFVFAHQQRTLAPSLSVGAGREPSSSLWPVVRASVAASSWPAVCGSALSFLSYVFCSPLYHEAHKLAGFSFHAQVVSEHKLAASSPPPPPPPPPTPAASPKPSPLQPSIREGYGELHLAFSSHIQASLAPEPPIRHRAAMLCAAKPPWS
jgi:hypothetical protein